MNRLKTARQTAGISQAQLGRILNCADVTISRYETGQRDMDSETVCKICDTLGCSADYLLGRSELPTNDLSAEEQEMILAFRKADWNYQEAVRQILAPFTAEATTAESAK